MTGLADAPVSPGVPADASEAYVVERDGLRLVVDPVALGALRTAQAAGIDSPASFGALPSLDELPLRVVAIEAALEAVYAEINRLRREVRDG
jgi:hypothetical protein